MDIIRKDQEIFATLNPETGGPSEWSEDGINLAQGRHDAKLLSFKSGVGYGVQVLNDGSIIVRADRSGQIRYFSVHDLVRIALADGLDPDAPVQVDSIKGVREQV